MNSNRGFVVLGVFLLVAGVALLLLNLGVLGEVVANTIWVLLAAAGGLSFLLVFFFAREQWWALIPGCSLLGLAVLIGIGDRGDGAGELGAGIFLASIGLSFWLVYLTRREFWWAIIPGGTLVSVAALVALQSTAAKDEVGVGVMFFGMALTFLLVYLSPNVEGRMRWALIPAGVLALLGVLMVFTLGGLINYIWALALIAGGVLLLWGALKGRR